MRVVPYGPRAALIDLAADGDPALLAGALRDAFGDDVSVVPAAATVLVDGAGATDVERRLAALGPPAARSEPTRHREPITIAVDYDGDDLGWVAEHTGLPVEGVISAHTAPTYVCAFCGFSPGFAYLTGLDPRLETPRRATPRVQVPAGAVAIAGSYTAVYPSATPGGWQLIGRTDAPVWDPTRADRPALVAPGDLVRFVARR